MSLVQSANPTPYDVAPISSCSPWNPRPARRITRFGRPSLLGSSSTTPEIELPDRKARLTPASRALRDVLEHPLGPVLVVADREERLRAKQTLAVRVRVDVGDVGDVVALLLQPERQRKLGHQELAGSVGQRMETRRVAVPVERIRPVEADVVTDLAVRRAPWRVPRSYSDRHCGQRL